MYSISLWLDNDTWISKHVATELLINIEKFHVDSLSIFIIKNITVCFRDILQC
jgi:hypothetical protein